MDIKSEFDGHLLKLVMRQDTEIAAIQERLLRMTERQSAEIAAIQEQLRHQEELIRFLEARQSKLEANWTDFGERSQLFLRNSWQELNERLRLLEACAAQLSALLPQEEEEQK